ncbi:hypothetical protein V502_11428 [Pseudogymnoascus sp. VKM F-4520 (FW-2644)]|nr:hypothetical protein V502_11428 [Pseudogymnoascus sp. VKM F-4520 (FW-2644)]
MSVLRFQTVWGVEPGKDYVHWAKWFPDLKAQGYTGVEIDITELLAELPALRALLDKVGLECTVLIHTEWPGYVGPKPTGMKPEHHLKRYRDQIKNAKLLKPIKINSQSGDDGWSIEESVEFFRGTLVADAEGGLTGKVSHETHRNRSFFSPYNTAKILAQVPELKVTLDISHHVVVAERLLDSGPDDDKLLAKIIPHVTHIHARIGTTQASQCPDPTNPVFDSERQFFEKIWKQVITQFDKSEPITFVPEYGPFPYHPIGSVLTFSELADKEGSRLQTLFEQWANEP